jgi:hypothetical protein
MVNKKKCPKAMARGLTSKASLKAPASAAELASAAESAPLPEQVHKLQMCSLRCICIEFNAAYDVNVPYDVRVCD